MLKNLTLAGLRPGTRKSGLMLMVTSTDSDCTGNVKCHCGLFVVQCTAWSCDNPGRRFIRCPLFKVRSKDKIFIPLNEIYYIKKFDFNVLFMLTVLV